MGYWALKLLIDLRPRLSGSRCSPRSFAHCYTGSIFQASIICRSGCTFPNVPPTRWARNVTPISLSDFQDTRHLRATRPSIESRRINWSGNSLGTIKSSLAPVSDMSLSMHSTTGDPSPRSLHTRRSSELRRALRFSENTIRRFLTCRFRHRCRSGGPRHGAWAQPAISSTRFTMLRRSLAFLICMNAFVSASPSVVARNSDT